MQRSRLHKQHAGRLHQEADEEQTAKMEDENGRFKPIIAGLLAHNDILKEFRREKEESSSAKQCSL